MSYSIHQEGKIWVCRLLKHFLVSGKLCRIILADFFMESNRDDTRRLGPIAKLCYTSFGFNVALQVYDANFHVKLYISQKMAGCAPV